MTSTEQKIFDIISQRKNARVSAVARITGLSSDYVHLVCQSLDRNGYIILAKGFVAGIPDSRAETGEIKEEQVHEAMQTEKSQDETHGFSVAQFEGMRAELITALENGGYHTMNDIAEAPLPKLMQCGMNVKQAADLINRARREVGIII